MAVVMACFLRHLPKDIQVLFLPLSTPSMSSGVIFQLNVLALGPCQKDHSLGPVFQEV